MTTHEIKFPFAIDITEKDASGFGFAFCSALQHSIPGHPEIQGYQHEQHTGFDNITHHYCIIDINKGRKKEPTEEELQLLKEIGWIPNKDRIPYPQISFETHFDEFKDDETEKIEYTFSCNMFDMFPGYFNDCLLPYRNNTVTNKLIENNIVSKNNCDSESSCSYFMFDTKEEAETFIEKLNLFIKTKYEMLKKAEEF
jgi:hypothetical protein